MKLQRKLYWLLLVALALLSPAAYANPAQAPTFKAIPPGSKVVLMPIDVELFSISAGGVFEPQAEWTSQAMENLKGAFHNRQHKNAIAFSEFPDGPDEAIESLNRLHGAVGEAINLHYFGPLNLPTKESRLEWTLGPDVSAIRQKTGADYALFTFMRDSYASGERVATMVVAAMFGVGLPGGAQVGYVSLVDLSTGDILWFNRLIRGTGDLRNTGAAKESLDALLDNFPD
ncbi:MAG: hypothetical protein EPN14_04965 [Gallionella sp.]|nr:MAG: hypothetical protein EPN14_04965 [Gallionella sp.]